MDFRELVKQLSQEFNTHIELRQIGVRDETAILGGIANCGRPLCCCQFLKDFASINVKMAKEQDLSLTPSTISGICGRLKCCLKYEHEGYLELEKTMPRRGELCECKEGRGRIVDRNLLTQKVTVQLDDSTHTVVCPASEVSVVYLDKYKIRAGGQGQGQGDAARQKTSESDEAVRPDAGTVSSSRPPRPQQGGQEGQQQRPHGQQRKPGERPQKPSGEQRQQQGQNRPQNQNRPQGQGGSRPQGQQRPQGQNNRPQNQNRPQGQGRPPRPPRPSNEGHDADKGGNPPQQPPPPQS